jgi:hypothetical protein
LIRGVNEGIHRAVDEPVDNSVDKNPKASNVTILYRLAQGVGMENRDS